MYQFRLSDEPIWSHGKDVDLLVCFNQEAWDLNWDSLGPEGVILYDSVEVTIPDEYLDRARPVRMDELAKEIGGSTRAKNMVAAGAITAVSVQSIGGQAGQHVQSPFVRVLTMPRASSARSSSPV